LLEEAKPFRSAADVAAARPTTSIGAVYVASKSAWLRVLPLASGTHALALADQAVVSGASFLTMILIGRWTGSRELGLYAIGMSVLSSIIAVQDSLIALPYTILKHRLLGTPEQRAGNALSHNFLLSALSAVILIAVAFGLTLHDMGPQAAALTWALAAATPFVLLREFGRRFGFAHLQMGAALALDAGVAAVQLGLLGWLQWNGLMSALAALGAIAAACGLAGIIWLARARTSFSISRSQTRSAMAESWRLGKWLFASIITVQVQWYATYWLSVTVLGAAAAGVYAACMSVVSFANPLITGLGNILTPRAVLARKNEGARGLRRQAIWDALFIGAAMGSFCVLIFLAGERVMRLLYPAQEYQGQGHTISVLAIALLAQAVGTPASSALASMERPRAILLAGSVGALVTVLFVWILMIEGGLLGAAYGFLIGNVVGAVGRWAAFLALVPRNSDDSASALQVIGQFTQCSPCADCVVTRLGEGDHATVVSVRRSDAQPVWQAQESLVLKLYKPEAGLNAEMVQAQFGMVLKLHAALHGHSIGGWKIFAPEPLFLCAAPPALIMTMAPGKDLNSRTAKGGRLSPQVWRGAARAVVGALQESWKLGQTHGDLALQNILCDIDAKIISFIDGGTHEHCRTCHENSKGWSPAALDLAHILSDVVTDVKRTIGNKGARLRREMFIESALQTFLETARTSEEKQKQLREIQNCARVHVEELLEHSVSPRGLWRGIVRLIALRRLDAMFEQLKAGLNPSREPFDSVDSGVNAERRA
jgi:O-antigen/teichoic acid export membrane protein